MSLPELSVVVVGSVVVVVSSIPKCSLRLLLKVLTQSKLFLAVVMAEDAAESTVSSTRVLLKFISCKLFLLVLESPDLVRGIP